MVTFQNRQLRIAFNKNPFQDQPDRFRSRLQRFSTRLGQGLWRSVKFIMQGVDKTGFMR